MKSNILTRRELYELVWSAPMPGIVKRLEVTEYYLRKIYWGIKIPIPYPGYWTSIRYGIITPVKTPLPDDFNGPDTIDLSLQYAVKKDEPMSLSPVVLLQKEIESDPRLNLVVSARLTEPDPLILAAQTTLTREVRYLIHDSQVGSESGKLDIRVSRPLIARALRFMDTFLKALQARGHGIVFRDKYTNAVVLDEMIEIRLHEKLKMAPGAGSWSSFNYEPTGCLVSR